TLAFGMQDVLLEPYGGQVLRMDVGATTWLTATWAAGGLVGFGWASRVLLRGGDPARMAAAGAAVGIPAFLALIMAATVSSVPLFVAGVAGIGFGGGLFSHGTLTLTMNRAPASQAGLALGAWGAVQATAAGVALAAGGLGRDAMAALAARGLLGESLSGPAAGYAAVYALEALLLLVTVVLMAALMNGEGARRPQPRSIQPDIPTTRSPS
ncbi:MAG: PucC family protein, partial [Rubrivivax sp.]|nr:PucC family protein [Rubrivivax sp.]